jgi:hypothetical protein
LRVAGRYRLIAVVKAEQLQTVRAGIGNVKHGVAGQLILQTGVPLLGVGSPQVGIDGVEFGSVGVRQRI